MDKSEEWPDNPVDALREENAHRSHLVGKVIEREGKFYQQFIDGELEVTLEHLKRMSDVYREMVRFFTIQTEKYSYIDWTVGDIPGDLDNFTKIDLFAENLEKAFEKLADENGGIVAAWPRLRAIADIMISQLKEVQYDYSQQSPQLKSYQIAKLEGVRNRWESLYQLNLLNSKSPNDDGLKQSGFESYINEEHRVKLMPYLVHRYTDQKPEQYGFMLYALVNLKLTPLSTLTKNKTALHRALKISFGRVGTRQSLDTAIGRLDANQIDSEDKRRIEDHKQEIQLFMKQVSTT